MFPTNNKNLGSLYSPPSLNDSFYKGLSRLPKNTTRLNLRSKIKSAWARLEQKGDMSQLILIEIQNFLDFFDMFIGEDHDEVSSERKSQIEEFLNDSRKYIQDEDIMSCFKFLRAELKKRVAEYTTEKPAFDIEFNLIKPFLDKDVSDRKGGAVMLPDWIEQRAVCEKKGVKITKRDPFC